MNKQMSSALAQGDQTEVVLIGKDGQTVETICSTEVAEMVGQNHKELLRSIRNYIGAIEKEDSAKLRSRSFFIEDTYESSQGKELPCYQVTRKGCEMIANKMTGQKGIVFTAKYIERFHKMEEYIQEQNKVTYGLLLKNQEELLEQFNLLDKGLTDKIRRLEEQAEFNHRPSHCTKLNWNKLIKHYAKNESDVECIKELVFAYFNISKWENLTADRFAEVYGYIREIAEKANLIDQISMFDNKEE